MVCDICGKDSNLGKAVFNLDPIELIIENYKGEEYKAFCTLTVQNKDDHVFLEGIKDKSNKELAELSERDDLYINTPEPHVCVACQKALSQRVLIEGYIDEDRVYKTKTKISFQQFMMPAPNPYTTLAGNVQLIDLSKSMRDFVADLEQDDIYDFEDDDFEDDDFEDDEDDV